MNIDRAREILNSHYNEFSLLHRYIDIPLSELDNFVGEDWLCIKEYLASPDESNHAKASTFADFLKEFKFYIQGKGSTLPINFHSIDYRFKDKRLSDEMKRIYVEIREKSNGKEANV